MFKNLLLKNYVATISKITTQTFLNSVDAKLLKPTPDQCWGPRKGLKYKCYEIEFTRNCSSGERCGPWASCLVNY